MEVMESSRKIYIIYICNTTTEEIKELCYHFNYNINSMSMAIHYVTVQEAWTDCD